MKFIELKVHSTILKTFKKVNEVMFFDMGKILHSESIQYTIQWDV